MSLAKRDNGFSVYAHKQTCWIKKQTGLQSNILSKLRRNTGICSLSSPPKKPYVLGIPVSCENFNPTEPVFDQGSGQEGLIVTFVNPLACSIARKSEQYLQNLKQFDWVLCDGIGMVLAARWTLGINVERQAFDMTSLAEPVLRYFAQTETPVILVGGHPGVAEKAARQFMTISPELNIVESYSGYENGPEQALTYLQENPQVAVICGMGAPRQEAFLVESRLRAWKGIGFTCGGFFDQSLEGGNYYPRWVDRLNVRFLYRLAKEPGRLWKRYLIDYQVFTGRLLKALINR
jgi:exopolysaccharide biosynthesis WecB/TagA/CpsF family protein